MKIERLLRMLIYLFNHKRVSAKVLAQRFDVSLRTVQRDIDTLTLAGFPIVAYTGYQGGYEIMEDYKLPIRLADDQDYQSMLIALRGLQTALDDPHIAATLEKLKTLAVHVESPIALDLSVMHENQDYNACIQSTLIAIQQQQQMICTYHNAQGITTHRILEPCLLQYRWYAWYVIAYDTQKQEYRRFKAARMEEIQLLNHTFTINHKAIGDILKAMEANDTQKYYDFDVRCRAEYASILNEYFNGEKQSEGTSIRLHLHLPKAEWQWKGRLLAMGDRIEILNEEVKAELCLLCHAFLNNHE